MLKFLTIVTFFLFTSAINMGAENIVNGTHYNKDILKDSIYIEINALFNKLDTINIKSNDFWENGKSNSHIYFKNFVAETIIKPELLSTPLKAHYEYSANIKILFEIFSYFKPLDNKVSFDLVSDINQNELYDIICIPGKSITEIYRKEWLNPTELTFVYRSYSMWFKLLHEHGLQYLQENNISPLNFCNAKWRLNFGYLLNNLSKRERITKTSILVNEINSNGMPINLNPADSIIFTNYSKIRLVELGVLSVLNTLDLFSNDIEKFHFAKVSSKHEHTICLEDKLHEHDINLIVKSVNHCLENLGKYILYENTLEEELIENGYIIMLRNN